MPLKKIDPCLTPKLLETLASMGQGDTIVVADANFPTTTFCKSGTPKEIRADGKDTTTMIAAILDLMPLDNSEDAPPVYFVCRSEDEKVASDDIKDMYKNIPEVEDNRTFTDRYEQLIEGEFREKAKRAAAIVHTRDNSRFGSVILRKGVVKQIHDIEEITSHLAELNGFEKL